MGKIAIINALSDIEEIIFGSIKELLHKKIVFQFNSEFIEYCSQKVKASEIDIYQALYSLLQKKYIVPGTALTRDNVLENQNRKLIYDTIYNRPGMHIRELGAILNLSSGVVRLHLRVLETFGYIRRKTYSTPKLTLLFSSDYPDTYDDYFVVMKNETDQLIIQKIIANQLTVTELSSDLEVHHSTIQYHLKKLQWLNLVIKIESDQTIHYTFNQAKKESFLDFLNRIFTYLNSDDQNQS